MGEAPDDIRHDVERARARLGQDLDELEAKVKAEFDWRAQFERRPWVFLGAAFGLAALFGMATARAPRMKELAPGREGARFLPSGYGRVWIEDTSVPVRRSRFQRAFSRAYWAS